MNKVIRFTKLRLVFFAVSIIILAGGIAGTVSNGGFNLGIDFNAGLTQRVQIAPLGFVVSYSGEDNAVFNIIGNSARFEFRTEAGVNEVLLPFSSHATIRSLVSAISDIPGINIELMVEGTTGISRVLSLNHPVLLNEGPARVNLRPLAGDVSLDAIRIALEPMGSVGIQSVGKTEEQEYMIRVKDTGADKDFAINTSARIEQLLSSAFGSEMVLIKQTEFIGPSFSASLGSQSFVLTLVALILILLYSWFRFKLAYAVSAIAALLHDVVFILGFLGTFQIEVTTATIAAVLTIIGYSLNDTIVIFDRIRENTALSAERNFADVINESITQSLSRTLITSLTTLIASVSLYIFGAGSIKDFALALTVGVVIGTYSSIVIASGVLLGWMNKSEKNRKTVEAVRYGARSESVKVIQELQPAVTKTAEIPKVERRLKGKRQKKK